ncbi:hypothetical protein VTI74DRAFT_7987 [Chaetomium olivicolor]
MKDDQDPQFVGSTIHVSLNDSAPQDTDFDDSPTAPLFPYTTTVVRTSGILTQTQNSPALLNSHPLSPVAMWTIHSRQRLRQIHIPKIERESPSSR